MAKPVKIRELHYPMKHFSLTQFNRTSLLKVNIHLSILSVCDSIMLRFILPSPSRARTSLGFEGKKFWNNRSYPGMERTEFCHKGSHQLHSKLKQGQLVEAGRWKLDEPCSG